MATKNRVPSPRFAGQKSARFYVPSYLSPHIESILEQAKDQIKQSIQLRRGAQDVIIPQSFEEWAQERFYIPQTAQPVVLFPHQIAYSRLVLTRGEDGHFPYDTIIYSTIKQSGKSTWAGMVLRWYAETGQRYSELYCIGNDMMQAKNRSFREIRRSLELTPGFDKGRDRLPGEWILQKETFRCVRTGTEIRALPVDAEGEAGGKPAMQCWTELWGAQTEDGLKFWDELTPIPTIPDSLRIVETYAGFLQDSTLLYSLYETGLSGHQLTAGELAERTGTELGAFAEAPNPDDLVPIWENKAAKLVMYWDSGPNARRMPWQRGARGDEYYRSQELSLPTPAFRRLHFNEWVSDTSNFIKEELWDACQGEVPPLVPGDNTPIVLGVDAATTGDCFAIVAVSRHPERSDETMVRSVRIFDPKETGGVVNYEEPETFIRFIVEGGHIDMSKQVAGEDISAQAMHPRSLRAQNAEDGCLRCANEDWDVPPHNVVQICFDPYQLQSMMQRIRKDCRVWCEEFLQAGDRLRADRALYDSIMNRRVTHNGNRQLKSHILNAGAKVQKDEDSTLRLVKITPTRKIDGAVALSMANARCLYLQI